MCPRKRGVLKRGTGTVAQIPVDSVNTPSELIRELADTHGSGFGLVASPDKVENEKLEALQSAKATLTANAPDELETYRQFVMHVTRSAADAAGGETSRRKRLERSTRR